jgi:hypothetical protein
MAQLNFMEQIALDLLRRRIEREESHIHKWSDVELGEIQQLERRTKVMAALAGATSGAILGAAELWLGPDMLDVTDAARWREQLPYWSTFVSLAVLVSGAELLCLYWFMLRAVARISSIAGLSLSTEEVEQLVGRGLSRAALELPNPREAIYGIDPYARAPRWKLVAYAILYRIKVGATSLVLRVLLRRILSRASLRFFIPLVAIAVFAIWNALITRWIMREVRLRVAAPLLVQDLCRRISRARPKLSKESRPLIVETVGEMIIRGADAHPNYGLLLTRLFDELEISPQSVRIEWDSTRAGLQHLSTKEQDVLLMTLSVAAILSSRLNKVQRELLAEAHRLCGQPFQPQALLDLRREFIAGQGLSEKYFEAVGAD